MWLGSEQVSVGAKKKRDGLKHAATEVNDVQCYYRLKMEPLKLQLSHCTVG